MADRQLAAGHTLSLDDLAAYAKTLPRPALRILVIDCRSEQDADRATAILEHRLGGRIVEVTNIDGVWSVIASVTATDDEWSALVAATGGEVPRG